MVNINKCNPHKYNLSGGLNNFKEYQWVLRPEHLKTADVGNIYKNPLGSCKLKKYYGFIIT